MSGKKGVVMQGGRCQGSMTWPLPHFMSFMSVRYVCMLFCQSTYTVAPVIPIANYNYLEIAIDYENNHVAIIQSSGI